MKSLDKIIKISATIEVKTGLHIGGGSDSVEIGGIDTPVIKLASKDNQPYIPGSSLRGKMRCLLEQANGIATIGGVNKNKEKNSNEIKKLFGFTDGTLSRLNVRDAMLTKGSKEELENCDNLDMPFTESKFENSIDRVTGKTEGMLRTTERVPAGAKFGVEFIIKKWDDDDTNSLISLLITGMKLLQADYLGGNGSRGYGQVEFQEIKVSELSAENNWNKWIDKKPFNLLDEYTYEETI